MTEGTGDRLTPAERLLINAALEWHRSGQQGHARHNLVDAISLLIRSGDEPLITDDVTLYLVEDDDDGATFFEHDDTVFPKAAVGKAIVLHPNFTWEPA